MQTHTIVNYQEDTKTLHYRLKQQTPATMSYFKFQVNERKQSMLSNAHGPNCIPTGNHIQT